MIVRAHKNIWQVGGMGLTHNSDACVYLIRLGDKAALIDAGTGKSHSQLVENINECLKPEAQLQHLLLTHCHYDHTGGAKSVRDQYGCSIVAHELDAIYLESGDSRVTAASWYGANLEPFAVDVKLRAEKEIISLGGGVIEAVHCPGHSPGSVVYRTEVDGRVVLFGQDLHGPIHSELLSNEDDYLSSLEKVKAMDADILLEGHFGFIEPKEQVLEFIQDCIDLPQQPCRC